MNIPKILREMPPFSWSSGYWKFGVIFTVYSFVANYVFAWCITMFGMFYQPLFWLLFSLLAWTVKPLMIDRMRPCSDCPLRENEEKYVDGFDGVRYIKNGRD